jgi:hypothetical protein
MSDAEGDTTRSRRLMELAGATAVVTGGGSGI